MSDLETIDSALKDRYPAPGTRIKQYVVDERKQAEWDRQTCPMIPVDSHLDNEGFGCCSGQVLWIDLRDYCCNTCDAIKGKTYDSAIMRLWVAERAKQPPICANRTLLSDEIAPEWATMNREHPLLKAFKR